MKLLTKATEITLLKQHVGTGFLILKTAEKTYMQVAVYIRPSDGSLRRIVDGQLALPVDLDYTEEY